ncbi:MAG TPA: MauE/DoxX family redox-associated membrane protein [Acidimicrobiales bacterium]
MAGAATACAVVLAVVFGWAAVAKAVRHRPTVAAFTELGLPAPTFLSVAVPAAEAAVAIILVLRPAIGGALALAALAAFTLVVVRALTRGGSAGCGCFGSRRIEPVSPSDVVRNGLLAAFAAVATGATHPVRPGLVGGGAVLGGVIAAGALQRLAHRRLGPPVMPTRA